jgi:hypothetical protein
MTENNVPVDYAIIGFAGNQMKGDIAAELAKLVESNLIRVVDALVISKDVDGQFTAFELNDLPEDQYSQFLPITDNIGGLFTAEDVETAAAQVPANCSALLLIWQNIFSAQFRRAVANANGILLAQDRIPAEVWNEVQAEIKAQHA